MMAAITKPTVSVARLPQLSVTSCSRSLLSQQHRSFSASPIAARQHKRTARRRAMEMWLRTSGSVFKRPRPGSTSYITSVDSDGQAGSARNPFPLNPFFRSQNVLSERIRENVYRRIIEWRQTVREVSVELGITMERVGAVARMMAIEQEWQQQGRPLNKSYQRQVLEMLPQTQWKKNEPLPEKHENINELPVHSSTLVQLFHPAPESRAFSRKDAAQIFDSTLLTPDERLPHPELIEHARDEMEGYRQGERRTRLRERILATEARRLEAEKKEKEREDKRTKVVEGVRWDFRFKDVNVDHVGKSGRSRHGIGWRYGAPHEDRKRGQLKIPAKIE